MVEPPPVDGPPRDAAAAERLATEDVPCLRCGYNLRGLKPHGVCPECGVSIDRSLHGNLLTYSAPEYVATLHTGLTCILLAVVTLVVGGLIVGIAGLLARDIWPEAPWIAGTIANVGAAGGLVLSIISVIGWWLFSAPDAAIIGHDTGDTPRKVLRVTVVISAIVLAVNTVGEFGMYQYITYDIIARINSLISPLAWIVSFFASLLYIRWLAWRLPSRKIAERAETYLWLLPVLFIVGFCVFMLGPLVATITYLLLIYDVRAHLGRIMAEQRKIDAETASGA